MNVVESNKRSVVVNPLALIDRIIADLELTPNQYDDATASYKAVAAALQKVSPQLRANIFPQGSMRLGTTVRPIQGERFDLDMVCWLAVSGKQYSPEQVYAFVWEMLGQNETYRQIRKRKNRCIRLEYAPERKFYLDVTPAIPDWALGDFLYVPDRELKVWCCSHPIGFCDGWFKKIAAVLPTIQRPLIARSALSESLMVNASAKVEPMPEHGAFDKTPLQRVVQLVKRDRDAHYQDDAAHRPSSILLTTIIAQSYASLVYQPASDLLEFVVKVVQGMPNFIHVSNVGGSERFSVANPANTQENFAENWTDEHYKRFRLWHGRMVAGLQRLQQSKGLGTDVLLNRMAESFGNENVIRAARAHGVDTRALHEAGKLRVAGGKIGSVGVAIPKTIYFGSEK